MTTTAVPLVLDVQGQAIPLPPGARLMATVLPMLAPSTMGGPVAQVAANPSDPAQLGLQNLTSQPWPARMPDGTERQVLPGQTLRLAEGVMLSWGGIIVQVRSALAPTAPQPPAQPPFGQPQWQAPQAAPNGWQGGQGGPIRPGQTPLAAPNGSLGMSILNPLFSKTSRPRLLALLVPGIILVVLTTLLFSANAGDELARTGNVTRSNLMHYVDALAAFLLLMVFTIMYQISGKQKPWWVFPPVTLTTVLLMYILFNYTPYFFPTPNGLLGNAIVGLREEAVKSVAVFICLWIGMKVAAPWSDRIGVREPLDGILIAAASATGFTAFETLTKYVPETIDQISQGAAGTLGPATSTAVAYLAGLELLVPRILNEFSGHVAWASYFGYFIGLSALMPKHRVKLLLIGWLTSAFMHDIWDTACDLFPDGSRASIAAQLVLGILSFALLAAVIVKARQLSPGRAMNFATKINRAP